MATTDDDRFLIKTALNASRLGGNMLTELYSLAKPFKLKADKTIVTSADIEVEQLVKGYVRGRHPEHGFIGEESEPEATSSPFTWIVDPLDGTKNFIRDVPLFSIEIAVLKYGVPIIGVSNLPLMNEILWAARGMGAHSGSTTLRVSSVDTIEDAYVSFGNLKHFAKKDWISPLSCLSERAFQCRGIGDAWSYHLLARGRLDLFIDAATAFWDIAALSVIVQEAGGVITTIEGRPIDETATSVIAANPIIHRLALQYFQSSHVS
jgi:histidinol-phosphatase